MTDMEKVIKGLECCTDGSMMCKRERCPYYGKAPIDSTCRIELEKDAFALLKEQEPHKKGYWKYPQSLDCCCSECGNQPDREPGESVPLYNYCPYCGAEMAVKWE